MIETIALNAAGHRRAPVMTPGYHKGRQPRNKGCRYPADPPTVEEIIAVMRATAENSDGARLRALIVILWRAGLRISEALDLAETDLDRPNGKITIRRGKGGRRREVGLDRWAWSRLEPWMEIRAGFLPGALLCVIHGPTAGRRWEAPPPANNSNEPPLTPAFAADLLPTNSDMRTLSRWRTKASRWS